MSKLLVAGTVALAVTGLAAANLAAANSSELDSNPKKHTVAAPEIDAASAGAALMLLGGGLIVLFGRKTVAKD